MIEFGRTLVAAREAKGYTIEQIAEATHMSPSTVEDLEKEDFTRIAAPIYGRGFVKLYCEAVGLDPKPMVAEFMDIFNGNHDTGIKERPIKVPVPAAPVAPEPPPAEKPPIAPPPAEEPAPAPAPDAEPDLFAPPPPPPTAPAPLAEPPAQDAEQPSDNGLFQAQSQPSGEPRLSRYAMPLDQHTSPNRPPDFMASAMIWRVAALVCVALVVIWLAFLGIRALYRATNAPADPEANPPAPTAEEVQTAKSKPATQSAPRTPQDIPALYID